MTIETKNPKRMLKKVLIHEFIHAQIQITDLKAQIEALQKTNVHLTTRFNEEYEVNKIHTERIKELETKNIELDTKHYNLDTYITDTANEFGKLKAQNRKLIDSLCSLIKQGER